MSAPFRPELLSNDLIQVSPGEILSLCGNFGGPWYRARLAFYPSAGSSRLIYGTSYKKAMYEQGYEMAGYPKVLDLPGEQHFLIHQEQIAKVHPAVEAFADLPSAYAGQCLLLIELLHSACGVSKDQHGLTGGGALHMISPASDFDWVIYQRDPCVVREFVTSNPEFRQEPTFSMEHVQRKYAHFQGLTKAHLTNLFKQRWKYFRFRGLRVSLSFVDPSRNSDSLIRLTATENRINFTGAVLDDISSYHMPFVIPVQSNTDGKVYRVATWLFLYNGAFSAGDIVEISGSLCGRGDSGPDILIEESRDYIRRQLKGER